MSVPSDPVVDGAAGFCDAGWAWPAGTATGEGEFVRCVGIRLVSCPASVLCKACELARSLSRLSNLAAAPGTNST